MGEYTELLLIGLKGVGFMLTIFIAGMAPVLLTLFFYDRIKGWRRGR